MLSTHGAQASMSGATVAAALSSASTLAGTATAGGSLFVALMKTTTTTKFIIAAGALLITLGTVRQFTRTDVFDVPVARAKGPSQPRVPAAVRPDGSTVRPDIANAPARTSQPTLRNSPGSAASKAPPAYDEAALKIARERQAKFLQRMGQLALMSDPLKVQEFLISEYGIHLSVDEISMLQKGGQKGFTFGLIDLWAAQQPQEALAWAASVISDPNSGGLNFHQLFLDAARKTLPNLDRDTLDRMVPEAPGKANLLDLADAGRDPLALANRILAVTDPDERASQLRSLAKGWGNPETAVEWARQNLSGTDKIAF